MFVLRRVSTEANDDVYEIRSIMQDTSKNIYIYT